MFVFPGPIRRDGIYQAQTPQGFDFRQLLDALVKGFG